MTDHEKLILGSKGRVKLSGVGPHTPPAGVAFFLAVEAVQGSVVTYDAAGCTVVAGEGDIPHDGSQVPTRPDYWPATSVQFNEADAAAYGLLPT